ncbi:PEP-CTERM sorting domain-containing protein [Coraliomargarita parva]|uniref:PEP-CTERM sorting domain-containing protein n=1 Tax=Coraliomargarita parva TaxID=3014050 RepID=UPI0022B342AC|nr:PEP-CTERM sorting domain-containing protein [Coraliomargarita parva]
MNPKNILLTSAALFAAFPIYAATYSWQSSTSGNWSEAANWDQTGFPSTYGNSVTTPTNTGTAVLDTDIELDQILNSGAAWTIQVSGTRTASLDSLVVGGYGSLEFYIIDPSYSLDMTVGNLSVYTGTLALGRANGFADRTITNLNVTGSTLIRGTLNVNATGTASFGEVNVDGGNFSIFALRTSSTASGGVTTAGLYGDSGQVYTTSASAATTTVLTGNLTIDTAAATDYTFGGTILDRAGSGTGGDVSLALVKNGTGTQRLSGANTYTNTTTVNAGTLLVNGTHTGAGAYQINGGMLGGTGSITTDNADIVVANGGGLTPGDGGVGTLTLDLGTGTLDLSGALQAANALAFQIDTIASSDLIDLTGILNIGTGLLDFDSFDFSLLAGVEAGTYTLISSTESIVGSLGATTSGTVGDWTFDLYLSGDNQNVLMDVATIPEPSTFALLAGLFGLASIAIRRRSR